MAIFTAEHYRVIADVLNSELKSYEGNADLVLLKIGQDAVMHVAASFKRMFEADNPQFNPVTFRAAVTKGTEWEH